MRRTNITLSVLLMLAAASSPGQAQQDPLVGTWKQNLAKSQYDPSTRTPTIATTVRRAAVGINGYKQTTDGMNAQGFGPDLLPALRPGGATPTLEAFTALMTLGRPGRGMPSALTLGLQASDFDGLFEYLQGRASGEFFGGRPALRDR